MEVDRVLRPGGYWVLSGPPINWKTYHKVWKRTKEECRAEQRKIEELAEQLCWEKKYENGDIVIFRKKDNAESCKRKPVNICEAQDPDDVWSVICCSLVSVSLLRHRFLFKFCYLLRL